MKIELSDLVKDKFSQASGVVTGRAEYVTGCAQVMVQPDAVVDGAPAKSFWLDEDRVEKFERTAMGLKP